MTVHCIEIMTSSDVDTAKVQKKIDKLKSKYGEELPNQNSDLSQSETIDGSVTFYRSLFRVALGKNTDKLTEKNDLLEQIRKEAGKSASWWQARWHECTHDDTTVTRNGEQVKACKWDDVQKSSSADIPDKVEF